MANMQQVGRHATTINSNGGTTEIVYHWTPVVSFNSKTITLYTGGWATVTTKTRMNQASNQFGLGYRVFQKNYDWFVDYLGETHQLTSSSIKLRREVGA